jgi:hypothetical protein
MFWPLWRGHALILLFFDNQIANLDLKKFNFTKRLFGKLKKMIIFAFEK